MPKETMTVAEHKSRHEELHIALDELLADFLHHNRMKSLTETTLIEFLKWSCEQTKNPTTDEKCKQCEAKSGREKGKSG